MISVFVYIAPILAVSLFVFSEFVRPGLPRSDLVLATSATAAPFGAVVAQATAPDAVASRLLTSAMIQFDVGGVIYYLNPADAIALVSALILLVRFLAWALTPIFRVGGRKDG